MTGGKGNDRLEGGVGADQLWGGADRDAEVYFTGDADTLVGGDGADELLGGGDADWVHAGIGNDTLWGAHGRDVLFGDADNDLLLAGSDNDTAWGGGGNDTLWGDQGKDVLSGEAGADELHGGDLPDTLDGGAGRDVLAGGVSWDTYRDDVSLTGPFAGQSITDVDQEATPTCQTLAGIAAAVRQEHDFRNQITGLGNNWYRVRLFPDGRARDVSVFFDGTWTDNDAWTGDPMGGDVGDYWVILLQRARFQLLGVTWDREMSSGLAWDVADNQAGGRLTNASDALRTLTGRAPTYRPVAQVTWQNLADWLGTGVILEACTPQALPAGSPLVAAHCYAITDAYVEAFSGRRMVQLYNPHGAYRVLTWDEFRANVAGVVSA